MSDSLPIRMAFTMFNKLIVSLLFAASACAFGQGIPKGFTVPDDTLSPDKRIGVAVPNISDSPDDARNSLVDARTGHVLAVIEAGCVGYNRMNHGGVLPSRWSPDGSVLVWQVDGKWSMEALVVVKLQAGRVVWQTNVLKLGELAILDRTKQAAPNKYAKARMTNVGGVDVPRSAYPKGFTIQVEVVGPVSFPLQITAELISAPKEVPRFRDLHLT
jgi:hypothetical protein